MSAQFTLSVIGLIGVVPLHFWSVEHEMLHERFGREKGRKVGEALGLISGWGSFLFSIGVWLSPQPRFSLLSAVSTEVVILGAHLQLSPVNAALAIPFLAAGGWLGVRGVAEVSLKVAETHRADRVVTTGAYSMVRHPQYLGGVLSHVGVSFLLSAWYSLLMTPIVGFLYYLLSWKEEQELVKEFGSEYLKYQGKVPMIIPKLRRSQPLSAVGLVQAASLDGTDLPAWSSRNPHDTSRGLGAPGARLGRGKKGFLLGYLSLFLVDIEGFPLGHIEASLNVNEKQLVEALLTRVLGECIEVELLAADSQFEPQVVFDLLDSLRIGHIMAWRRLKWWVNPADMLSVKDRIDVEGPEWKRAVYKHLRAVVEGFNGRVKSRAAYSRLTWQGLGNASIHVSLVLMVVYAVSIAAYGIGRTELRQSKPSSLEGGAGG